MTCPTCDDRGYLVGDVVDEVLGPNVVPCPKCAGPTDPPTHIRDTADSKLTRCGLKKPHDLPFVLAGFVQVHIDGHAMVVCPACAGGGWPGKPLTCADHTPSPERYLAWHEWADKMTKTHKQIQCPECQMWMIWIPK